MSSIFISHHSSDNDIASEISTRLKADGHRSVFLDFHPVDGLPAGSAWEHELYQRLRGCRAVVAVCSQAAMDSRWCLVEITYARALGKPVLAVNVDGCQVHQLISDRQVIDYIEPNEGFGRLRLGLLAAGLDPKDSFDWDGTRPPYPGLLSFDELDAAVFFGREKELTDGLALLNREHRLGGGSMTVVFGASGSGKSSLVRAGLVPRLRGDPDRWIVVDTFRPRDSPWRELAAVLSRTFDRLGQPRSWAELHTILTDAESAEERASALVDLATELRLISGRDQAKVLLVVDQFEELLGPSANEVGANFISALRQGLETPGGPLLGLCTLRSDYLTEFQTDPSLLGAGYHNLSVGPLSVEDLVQVIEKPAEIHGIDLEPGLSQAMVADAEGASALPMLAFGLRELLERFGSERIITVDNYALGLGRLDGAIARVADEVLDAQDLSPRQQEQLRHAFLSLVRPSEDGRWTRRVVDWESFHPEVQPVLEAFVRSRLLVAEGTSGRRTLEVAHEALFDSWGQLASWLEQSYDDLWFRHELERATHSHRRDGSDASSLWRGQRLARAAALFEETNVLLAEDERSFVEASLAAQSEETAAENRRRNRQVRMALVFSALTTLAAVVALVFWLQARASSVRADDEARQATSLALALRSGTLGADNPALALALAAEADALEPLGSASAALFEARAAFGNRGGQPLGGPLLGHSDRADDVAISPDGSMVASASADQSIRLWDAKTGEPIGQPLLGHNDFVQSVAFSPAGTQLASASDDGTVRLWNPRTGEAIGGPMEGHTDFVWAAVFSPDGLTLASASDDGTVRFWDVASGAQIGDPLVGHDGGVLDVAFSPDGTFVASAGRDGTIRRWDPETGAAIGDPIAAHEELVLGIDISPDSSAIASAAGDGTVGQWNARSGEPLGDPFTGHVGIRVVWVFDVAYSPDGTVLASGSSDGTVRLSDPASGAQLGQPLTGQFGTVLGLAFSPDGTMVASSHFDGSVQRWSSTPGQPVSRALTSAEEVAPRQSVAFSPSAELVAGASDLGTVQLWNTGTSEAVGAPWTAHDGAVTSLSFSPDGLRLATAGTDGLVRLWDPSTGDEVDAFDHGAGVTDIAFGHDGLLLASAGMDGKITIWDATTGLQVGGPIEGHDGPVLVIAFAPDSTIIASGGQDKTLRLWEATTGQSIGQPMLAHTEPVNAVVFSPDGKRLISAGDDQLIRVWNPDDQGLMGGPLVGHTDFIWGMAVSPDGELLASASRDGQVRLWELSGGRLLGVPLIDHADAVFAVAFALDGQGLGTASRDGTVRLWDPLWDREAACQLIKPYVGAADLRPFLAVDSTPVGCDFD